jgi:hypothetical protein
VTHCFTDPIDLFDDEVSPFVTTALTAGPGNTVIAAGGVPAIRDSADGETFFWAPQARRMSIVIDPADLSSVTIMVERQGGNAAALKDAWISYWEA